MKYLVFLFTLCSLSSSMAEVIDRIIAVVNDDIVTQSDASTFMTKLKNNGLIDEALLNMYDRQKLKNNKEALIEFLIEEKTIDTEAKRQGLVTPIEQVEGEIQSIARSRGISRNQLKEALSREGVNYSDYQDFVKTSLQRQTLLQKEVTSKIKISDEDINAYYIANFSSAKALVFEYTLAHILLLNTQGGATEAEKRANTVYDKIKSGLPFETLAAQYSEDPNFVQGGHFGTFKVSDFNKNVESSISKLDTGDISEVVAMPDGYRIFKVLKKSLVPSPDLEAKREGIRQKLLSENFKKQFRVWLEQKKRDSHIRIN